MKWKLLFFSQLYNRADERDQRFDVTVEKGEKKTRDRPLHFVRRI